MRSVRAPAVQLADLESLFRMLKYLLTIPWTTARANLTMQQAMFHGLDPMAEIYLMNHWPRA